MKHLIMLDDKQLRIIQLALAGYASDGIRAAAQNPSLTDAFTKDNAACEEMINMFAPLILLQQDEATTHLCPSVIDFTRVFESTTSLARLLNHQFTTAGVAETVFHLNESYHEMLQYYAYKEWCKENSTEIKVKPELYQTLITSFVDYYKELILSNHPGVDKLYIPAPLQQDIDNVGKQVQV